MNKFLSLGLCVLLLQACAAKPPAPPNIAARSGAGEPAVVLQAGFGDGKEAWVDVLPALAKDHAVFAYDRPGTGGNPPTDAPRDPCTIATELRTLLQREEIHPPYILVGHSLGGLYQYAYAKLYPQDVAGFVLVDPTHPGNWDAIKSEQPSAAIAIASLQQVAFSATRKAEFRDQTRCLDTLDMKQALTAPGVVLISGRPDAAANADYEKKRLALAKEWAPMTGIDHVQMVWDSAHYIQREKPQEVIDAVSRVTAQIAGRADMSMPVVPVEEAIVWAGKPSHTVLRGKTSRTDIESYWGKPDTHIDDDGAEIWVYEPVRLNAPAAVSFIPVVGDIVDAVEVAQTLQSRRELVLQFDRDGLLSSWRLREIR